MHAATTARRSPLPPLIVLSAVLCVATPALAPAQHVAKDHLVGWVSNQLLPSSGRINLQDVGACTAPTTVCNAALLNNANAIAGGAAYDPRQQALWACDDRTLELFRLGDCKPLCQTTPQRQGSLTISGLAISDRRRLMFQLETAPGTAVLETYDLRACPPGQAALRPCSVPIAAAAVAAGLAFDEARELLYVSSSERLLGGYRHLLHVLQLGATAPCGQFVCTVQFTDCSPSLSGAAITGLAYESCSQLLYATTGTVTRTLRLVDPLHCNVQDLGCCNSQGPGGFFAGIDVVPGWSRQDHGTSCLGTPCPSCPAMRGDLAGGDPSLGNQEFAAALNSAPAGGQAFLLLGAGPCTAGLPLPFLCGPVFPAPAPLLVVPAPLSGTGCLGAARVPLPIPVDPGLCGGTLCSQWLVLCAGAGGAGASNAVQFTIAGS